jgi:protoporphyrinogen oxidase
MHEPTKRFQLSARAGFSRHVVVIGAGPAGLTAAVQLCRHRVPVTVLEKDMLVGGIARTGEYKGYRFDIGGHRFFTKIPEVDKLWHELLDGEFLIRPRLSRIYYRHKFFDYPLRPFNAVSNLGLLTSMQVIWSYLQARVFPYLQEDTFEQWVCNRFGRKLFDIFFRSYTEKVWGLPCSEIRADWAAQRIQGLSLPIAIKNALLGARRENAVKTLIRQFHYPRRGPGQMWRAAQNYVEEHGGCIELKSDVVALRHRNGRITEVITRRNGREESFQAMDVITSMSLSELIRKFDPPAPRHVLLAADRLTYRDFLSIILIVNQPNLFPDNWIYIHEPEVRVGRVQNFKNWSPQMVPDPRTSSLGLEYFCNEGDALWTMPDAELVELGKREMSQIGLLSANDVIDGTVIRQPKAYPVYNGSYASHLAEIKGYLSRFRNLQTIGRNGLHKYNNQDHSMLTAMLAVRNLFGGQHDLWQVNTERSYHEEIRIPAHSVFSSDEAGVV